MKGAHFLGKKWEATWPGRFVCGVGWFIALCINGKNTSFLVGMEEGRPGGERRQPRRQHVSAARVPNRTARASRGFPPWHAAETLELSASA